MTLTAATESSPPRDGVSALLAPRAIAILGASGRAGNPFARPLHYLLEHGFGGPVYPVNPGYTELEGQPCHATLDDLPGPVDLVLMLVSAAEAVRQLPAVARAGARAAVVFASGFAEIGPEGQALQSELVVTAREHGIRLLGPNCQGLVSLHDNVVASFTAALELGVPEAGSIAYVGQSGAVGGSIFSLARERGLRIGAWVSTGNQADLTALEVALHLVEDERITVLTLYLESPPDGADFDRLTRRAAATGTSVLVLQSALSTAGARAASSHTGALIGANAAFRAMCRERGVLVADDVEDFIATAHALSVLPRAAGRRLAIVTTSGGAGSLAADQAEFADLVVEDLSAGTQDQLKEIVPDFGATSNPVDVTAQMFRANETGDFVRTCELTLADPGVDAVIVVLTMVTGDLATSMAHGLQTVWSRAPKPVVVVWLAARQQTMEAREIIRANGWPVLDSVRTGTRVLESLVLPAPVRSVAPRHPAPALVEALAATTEQVVTEAAGARLLEVAGVDTPRHELVTTAEEATEAAERVGSTTVLKVSSPLVLHKTERGGVVLDVAPSAAASAYAQIVRSFAEEDITDVVVQEQVPAGPELLVGVTHLEPGFPPLLTIGMGGVATELYQDSTCRLLPVDEAGVLEMVHQLTAAPLLTGYRGQPATDLAAVARAVVALGDVALAAGDRLVELEVNPLRIVDGGSRVVALDFILRLNPTAPDQTENLS